MQKVGGYCNACKHGNTGVFVSECAFTRQWHSLMLVKGMNDIMHVSHIILLDVIGVRQCCMHDDNTECLCLGY